MQSHSAYPPVPLPVAEHREKIRAMLKQQLYGPVPEHQLGEVSWIAPPGSQRQEELGLAQVKLRHSRDTTVLVSLPKAPRGLVVGINFRGNHWLTPADWVPAPSKPRPPQKGGIQGLEQQRGKQPAAFPLEMLAKEGFAVATFHTSDIVADDPDLARPVLAQFSENLGAIGLWGWGLASVGASLRSFLKLDCPLIAVGHSRLGKAALAAGAMTDVFGGIVPIQSGTGGAAPSRKTVGETVAQVTSGFPHWFTPQFATWAGKETEMPFDQNWALAACSPSKILLLGAVEDQWADPDGQTKLLQATLPAWPDPRALQSSTRPGGHEVKLEDWQTFLTWCQIWLPR